MDDLIRKRMEESTERNGSANVLTVRSDSLGEESHSYAQINSNEAGSSPLDTPSASAASLRSPRVKISFLTLLKFKENHWTNFFIGIFLTFIPILIGKLSRSNPGMEEGALK